MSGYMEVNMGDNIESGGTPSIEYRNGLFATYRSKEYPAVYLGLGRLVLYSDTSDEYFTFPSQDGRYLLQTDLRDENLIRVYDVRTIGVIKECYESVNIMGSFGNSVLITTYNPRLGFLFGLKSSKEYGFFGLIERELLIGSYDERDYLWNPIFGICSTLCNVSEVNEADTWFAENDRLSQLIRI
jgi:hypothetical protein